MSLTEKIAESHKKQLVIRLRTRYPDGDIYDGMITHIRKPFIVLASLSNFAFDGIVVLPKKVISGYRDGKYERRTNSIMQFNGNIKKNKTPKWLDKCETLADIVAALQKNDIWPCIETIHRSGSDTDVDFYIGRITDVGERCFNIHHYDAAGEWEGECEIDYKDLFRIEFNDEYSRQFNKYMKEQGKYLQKNCNRSHNNKR